MITIENLIFAFKKNTVLFFDNVTFSFRPQALNFIQGKNGVGKSTLLRILKGDIRQNEVLNGALHIDSINCRLKKSHDFVDRIAIVSQNFNEMLVDTCTFSENLQFALLSRFPGFGKLPQIKQIPYFVEKYGISYNVPISLLSGGQRQLLAILMVLQKSPRILLLDEPTATLDEENTQLIMDFLAELCLREHITIVLIVHNREIIQKYCGDGYLEIKKEEGGKRIVVPVVLNPPASC